MHCIDMLTDKGFQTVPETARQYLDKELARGRPIEEILWDVATEPARAEMQLTSSSSTEP